MTYLITKAQFTDVGIMGRSQGTHINPSIEYVSHKDHITHKFYYYLYILRLIIINFKSTIDIHKIFMQNYNIIYLYMRFEFLLYSYYILHTSCRNK